jgi:rhodanese-related sulfurtransferase
MDRLFEFVINHYILVSLFAAFVLALLYLESHRGGAKISAAGAISLINKDEAIVVDIRDRKEFAEGRITGSVNIPLSGLKSRVSELAKHKDKQIIVADKAGQHSGMAVKQLKEEGFSHVMRLDGGVSDWRANNLPLVKK